MNIDDLAFVWPGPSGATIRTEPYDEPVCSVAAWPGVLGCELLFWDSSLPHTMPVERIRARKVFMVNLFWGSQHVTQIKQINPDAWVIAMPDPYLEVVLYSDNLNIWGQMAAADFIGGRTPQDVEMYGTLLGKPALWLPSPIGPDEAFQALWVDVDEKEDVIVAVEHHWLPRSEAPTLAALAAIQREAGLPVEFYGASAKTQQLARLADGLEVDFREKLPYPDFVKRLAGAHYSVDLYMAHAQGRHLMTCAMAGTPCIGSAWNNFTGIQEMEPFDIKGVVGEFLVLHEMRSHRAYARRRARELTNDVYGFEASRERVAGILERLS